ncbi:MAG: universal stress protein [Methanomassiliicoccales archaeon]|nr:universal stress protein [Methanomassiliicoccales archaeon]
MNILLATDGSKNSEKAESYAFEYAKLFKATLCVAYSVNPKPEEDKEQLVKAGMDQLTSLKAKGTEMGVEVKTFLEAGNPYEAIMETAKRVKAEAIIVGTSGKTAIDRVLIGSVSEYVVRHASCTVIVVR